jgi:hypothetical protein
MRLRRSRERLEQRPVEQALVDRADEPGGALVFGAQRVGIVEVERACEGRAEMAVGRQVVRLQVAHDLQTVLHAPQEPVGVGQRLGIGVGHVPLGGERPEHRERVRCSQALVSAAVHDLQQLHRELDVADPAAAALDLDELLPALTDVLLEPHLGAADVVDRAGRELGGIHERLDAPQERLAELGVARDRASLDQRLAFPGRRLALVVREGPLERAAERPCPSPGPQADVDSERDALRGRFGQRRGEGRHGSLGALLGGRPGARMHEQQVDVARVVQLRPAELAEPDHGEPWVVDERQGKGTGDADVGDRADLGDDVVEPGALEVPGGHAEHRATPEPPEPVELPQPIDVVRELGTQGLAVPLRDVGERDDLLGMCDEEVRRRGRESEEPSGRGGDLGTRERISGGRILAHARERDPSQLRVGRLGERPAEHLGGQHPGIIAPATSLPGREARPISRDTLPNHDRAPIRPCRRISTRRRVAAVRAPTPRARP